ncbi:MAG: zinc ribbon domain-containing protein [Clostridia bacterium]|nr:zinc ribbon domain-containing protein [Clostridia bacterium]
MKKKDRRFVALYAAPGFFRPQPEKPDDGQEETPRDYPESHAEKDDRGMVDVYACPMPGEEPEEPTQPGEPTQPDEPSYPQSFVPDTDPNAFMCVYAGPDWFAGRWQMAGAFVGNTDVKPEATEEPAPETPEDDDDEKMRILMEEMEKNPPQVCGLVMNDPSKTPINMMGMGMRQTPNYCPECGTPCVRGDKFCRNCGEKLI